MSRLFISSSNSRKLASESIRPRQLHPAPLPAAELPSCFEQLRRRKEDLPRKEIASCSYIGRRSRGSPGSASSRGAASRAAGRSSRSPRSNQLDDAAVRLFVTQPCHGQDAAEQHRLARAVRPHLVHPLPVPDRQIHAVQDDVDVIGSPRTTCPILPISNTLVLPRQPPRSSRMRRSVSGRSTRSIRSSVLNRTRAWHAWRSSTTTLASNSNHAMAASIWLIRFCCAL